MSLFLNGLRPDLGKGGAGLAHDSGDAPSLLTMLSGIAARSGPAVASLAALAAMVAADRSDGMIVAVAGELWQYSAEAVSGLAPDDGVGRWARMGASSGVPGAGAVVAWYVDTGAGDDGNDGLTVGSPVSSIAEVLRRIGRQTIGQDVVVTVTGNTATALAVDVQMTNGATLYIQGVRTVLSSHTLTAVTPYNAGTSTLGAYTLSGSPDYSAARFARLAASHGQTSPIATDLGGGAFRGLWIDGWDTWAQIEPSNGAAVDLYTVPTIAADISIAVSGFGYVGFLDLDVGTPGANHSVRAMSGGVTYAQAIVRGCDVYRAVFDAQLVGAHTFDCRAYAGNVNAYASTFASAGGSALAARSGGVFQVQSASLLIGGNVNAGHVSEGPGTIVVNDVLYLENYADPAIDVLPGSNLIAAAQIVAKRGTPARAVGCRVRGGGALRYASGKLPKFAGTAPTADFLIGGTSKASAAVPFVETANGAAVVVDA